MLVGEAGWRGGGVSADWLGQAQQSHVVVVGARVEERMGKDLLHLDPLLAGVRALLVNVSWEGAEPQGSRDVRDRPMVEQNASRRSSTTPAALRS